MAKHRLFDAVRRDQPFIEMRNSLPVTVFPIKLIFNQVTEGLREQIVKLIEAPIICTCPCMNCMTGQHYRCHAERK